MNKKALTIGIIALVAVAGVAIFLTQKATEPIASKPEGVTQSQKDLTIKECDAVNDRIEVKNIGTPPIKGEATIYEYYSNEEVGKAQFNTATDEELSPDQTEWIETTADLQKGGEYMVIEAGLPTVDFTC